MPSGELYVAVTALLLLIALGASIPVLRDIVLDGIDRQRTDPVAEDSTDDTDVEAMAVDGPRVACEDCGTANDPGFSYCRECGGRL